MAAAANVDLDRWRAELSEVMLGVGSRFGRREPCAHAGVFVLALVSGLVRSNCWTVAEHAGHASPEAMQRLLAAASGRRTAAGTTGVTMSCSTSATRRTPRSVRCWWRTLKKGQHTVGVQRQYTGTAGRIENAQVGVYRVDATSRGHAFLDREL